MSNKQTAPTDDEWQFTDLNQMVKRMGTGLENIKHWFTIQLKKNWLAILLVALLITGWQIYRIRTYVPFYESRASFVYQELHKKTYGEMIDQLNQLVQERSYTTVAKSLNIPEKQAQQILSVEALNLYGSKLSEDITTDKSPFYIRVKVSDKSAFDSLSSKVSLYLNSNPYYVAMLKRKQASLKTEIDQLNHELQLLDSIKYQYIRSNGAIRAAGTEPFNPVLLFDKSIDISKAIAEKQTALDRTQSVELLNDFMVAQNPVYPDQKMILLKSVLLFAVITLAIMFLSSILKKNETIAEE